MESDLERGNCHRCLLTLPSPLLPACAFISPGGYVEKADIECTNGVIHVMDTVMIPGALGVAMCSAMGGHSSARRLILALTHALSLHPTRRQVLRRLNALLARA
jgi:hypothetical protein